MTHPLFPQPSGEPSESAPNRAGASGGKYVGRRLGKFRIVGELGRGGMGVVFEACDTVLERHVAIKLLPLSLASRPDSLERFLREARAAAKLHHPHVVAVYEADQFHGQYYIVLELVRGGNLSDSLKNGPLNWREATRVMVDACRGLEVAHRAGLIHRDIKPSNLMRSEEGVVKLADFGLVRPVESLAGMGTSSGTVMGTPHFMSPEQCRSELADERTDIYGMGATFFFLLTGRPPYPGDAPLLVMNAHLLDPIPDPRQWNAEAPSACAAIIQRAMAKEPEDRYESVADLIMDLEAALRDPVVIPPPVAVRASVTSRYAATERVHSVGAELVGGEVEAFGKQPLRRGVHGRSTWAIGLGVLIAMTSSIAAFTVWWKSDHKKSFSESRSSLEWAKSSEEVARKELPREVKSVASVGGTPSKPAGQSPAIAAQRRKRTDRLAAPITDVTFRAWGMKPDDPPRMPGRTSWSMNWPGVFRVEMAQSGEFLVIVANSEQPPAAVGANQRIGSRAYVSAWGRDGRQRLFEELSGRATSLAVSADSRLLAVGEADGGGIQIWRTSDWQQDRRRPPVSARDIDSLALSDNGHWLAFASHDKFGSQWSLWDVGAGRWLAPSVGASAHRSRAIGFAPEEGIRVMTGSDDGNLRLWEQGATWTSREFRTGVPVAALAFAPDRSLVAVGASRYFALWSYLQGKRDHATLTKTGEVRCVAFSPTGRHVCWAAGSTVECIDLATLRPIAKLTGFQGDATAVTYTPDGSRLLMATSAGELVLWWME